MLKITTPVGRLVQGDIYKPQTTDDNGQPLVYKNGANAGQPRVVYFLGVAIPKAGEQHWSQTAWGQQIWNLGHAEGKQAAQRPDFAWKIIDGDSTVPNQNGKRPCDNENFRGHWIVRLQGGFQPKVYVIENGGFVEMQQAGFCKPGHFVEVCFTVDFNGDQRRPGMYLNPLMLCHRAYGPEIVYGPDVSEAGFGASPLPAGASTIPMASTAPMPTGAAPVPPAAAVQYQNVAPNPQFVANAAAAAPVHTPPPPPPAAAAPVPPPARQMTAKAGGATYEQFIGNGWSDAALIAEGYMLP